MTGRGGRHVGGRTIDDDAARGALPVAQVQAVIDALAAERVAALRDDALVAVARQRALDQLLVEFDLLLERGLASSRLRAPRRLEAGHAPLQRVALGREPFHLGGLGGDRRRRLSLALRRAGRRLLSFFELRRQMLRAALRLLHLALPLFALAQSCAQLLLLRRPRLAARSRRVGAGG